MTTYTPGITGSPSVLDRVNRMNRLIRQLEHDTRELRFEVAQFATMFGIVQPTAEAAESGEREAYRQDVPYFTPVGDVKPLFGSSDVAPYPRDFTVNPDEPVE